MDMEIIEFDKQKPTYIEAGAALLKACFPESYGEDPLKEMKHILGPDRVAFMAMDDGELIGFIGAIPQYEPGGWELHPLAVKKSYRKKGIGKKLVESLEKEVARRGGIMIYLGTDDERFQTSLSDDDLFENTFEKIEKIINYHQHPYEFYEKIGYQIVGVLPDANGYRKPDILMAKRVALVESAADRSFSRLTTKEQEKLKQKIKEIRDFSGVVSIKKGGKVYYQEAFGYAELSNQRRNTTHTRFAIASGAKFFTALGIAKLVEQSKLTVEDRLKDSTDLFPDFHSDVRIKHLLSHTSGIPDYFDEEVMENFSELWIDQPMYLLREPRDFLPLITSGKTMFSPGERFHYNNGAYIVLGLVIEKVSGMGFSRFIKRHVLDPAKMSDSGYFSMDQLPENTALGYFKNEQGDLISNIYSVPVIGGPDGGIFVTADDITRLWQSVFNGGLITKEIREIFFSSYAKVQQEVYYGYGMWVRTIKDVVYKYMIMGEDPGVNFRSSFYPENEWEVTVLCNREFGADDLSI